MRFDFPLLPAEFEIFDEWWVAAGMVGFEPLEPTYCSSGAEAFIPLREIQPPFRSPEQPRDWHGFERVRLITVLRGIAARQTSRRCP